MRLISCSWFSRDCAMPPPGLITYKPTCSESRSSCRKSRKIRVKCGFGVWGVWGGIFIMNFGKRLARKHNYSASFWTNNVSTSLWEKPQTPHVHDFWICWDVSMTPKTTCSEISRHQKTLNNSRSNHQHFCKIFV